MQKGKYEGSDRGSRDGTSVGGKREGGVLLALELPGMDRKNKRTGVDGGGQKDWAEGRWLRLYALAAGSASL